MKTIFITGASVGLGKTTAKLFQSNGWKFIATMRNPEKETELSKLENVTILKLDVTDLVQILLVSFHAIMTVSPMFGLVGYRCTAACRRFECHNTLP